MSVTTELSTFDDPTTTREMLAIAGFLAGYGTSTRTGYATDLRIFNDWCREYGLSLFDVQRSHLDLFARSLRAIPRRSCPPPQCRQRVPDPRARSQRTECVHGPGRIGTRREHALASLLSLNGLRVSEALNADIDDLGFERGHHTLRIIRKGGKQATVPLAPRTARAVRLYLEERSTVPIFLGTHGQRMDRHAADRAVKRIARKAGINKRISPHSVRYRFIPAALDAGVALRDVQDAASHSDPRTTMRYDRARHSLDRHATYVVAAFVAGAS